MAADFFVAAFLVADFFVAAFLVAVVFLAARLRVTGPRARFSANSSAPRSGVIVSGSSSLRRVALVSPSVTYAPNRPSLTTIGLPDTGSLPSSLSGAAAALPRSLGWA